jgi:hypothetical protein
VNKTDSLNIKNEPEPALDGYAKKERTHYHWLTATEIIFISLPRTSFTSEDLSHNGLNDVM